MSATPLGIVSQQGVEVWFNEKNIYISVKVMNMMITYNNMAKNRSINNFYVAMKIMKCRET